MFSPLRSRFGIPGVISIIALVFAMAGGAYAAKKYVITSTSQIKPSVLKALKGPAGPAGSPGAKGDNGGNGAKGDAGGNGNNGANGKSVAVTKIEPGEPGCEELGGAEVKQEGASSGVEVCTGEPGVLHPEETLPPGASETGSWDAIVTETEFGPGGIASISFPIPLEVGIAGTETHYDEPETENCPGTATEPEAKAGHLCLYQGANFSGVTFSQLSKPSKPFTEAGADPSGSIGFFEGELGEFAWGTWAVTAP